MNIVQFHLGIKARLDQVSTPRFKDSQLDNAINSVSSWIVQNKVAGVAQQGKRLSFQKTQMIRDELYTIVKELSYAGSMTLVGSAGTITVGDVITGVTSGTKGIVLSVYGTTITFNITSSNPLKKFSTTEALTFVGGTGGTATGFTELIDPIVINSDNKTIKNLPSDYRYLLGLEIEINSVAKDWCAAISYDELFTLEKDPYARPSQDFPYNFYYVESSNGLESVYDQNTGDILSYARIYYLSEPVRVFLGDKFTSGTSYTGNAIAYTNCTYNSETIKAGTAFTIVTAGLFTSGTAVKNFVNSDLPPSLHDEIIFDAAKTLNSDIENYDKWKVMKEDEMTRKK